jgi:CHASE3 domain sensor protein
MADHCDLHSEVTQKVGEFSAQINNIIGQIDRMTRDIIEGGKVDAKLLSDYDYLKQNVTRLSDLCVSNKETFETYQDAVRHLDSKFNALEALVTSYVDKINAKVDKVTFDNHVTQIESAIDTIKAAVDKKASQEAVNYLKAAVYGVVAVVIGAIVAGLVRIALS